jgi:hypothetical protein
LSSVLGETNVLRAAKRRKVDWFGNILCRNCLLKHVIEGKIEEKRGVRGRQGRRRKQLMYKLKERR